MQNYVETVHKCDIYCFFDKLRQNYASVLLVISGEVFSSAKSDIYYSIKEDMAQEKIGMISLVYVFQSKAVNKYAKGL